MAQLALHGVHFRHYSKPGKADIGFFDSEIHLERNLFQPYSTVVGKFVISTSNEVVCYGIRVQLDATINLKFDTKVDNRVTGHKKIEGLLEGCSAPGDGYYILSPVREQLFGEVEEENRQFAMLNAEEVDTHAIIIQPGTHTYPFTLMMPGEPLPAPFRSQYGNLQYKIVVYMRSSFCYIQVAENALRFRGYNNLLQLPPIPSSSQMPNYMQPLKHESGFQKSVFSSKKVITVVLTVDKTGFLAGEDLPFVLSINNSKLFLVKKVATNFVRRVVYNVNGSTKTTIVNLDSFESNEMSRNDEICYTGKLAIPRNCMPSYNVKQVYSVIHLIQYQVKVSEYPGSIKGQVEVVIGTTKDSVNSLMSRRMSTLQIEDSLALTAAQRNRSDSLYSRLSDSSMMTTISLPPAYSQLSSRAVSMNSLETLPPHYDDILQST